MSELGKEELLECLNTICDRAVSADEQLQDMASQAYAQLVEIVKQHFSAPTRLRRPRKEDRRWAMYRDADTQEGVEQSDDKE